MKMTQLVVGITQEPLEGYKLTGKFNTPIGTKTGMITSPCSLLAGLVVSDNIVLLSDDSFQTARLFNLTKPLEDASNAKSIEAMAFTKSRLLLGLNNGYLLSFTLSTTSVTLLRQNQTSFIAAFKLTTIDACDFLKDENRMPVSYNRFVAL